MKWLLLFIQISFLLPAFAVTISIGTDQIVNQPFPINASYDYSYSQIIYLQQEIQHQGVITQISYQYHVASNEYLNNVNQLKIYMGMTNRVAFNSNTNWFPLDSLQLVFDGNWDVSNFSNGLPGDGWVTIQLTNSFSFDNSHNLVIAVDENQPGFTGIAEKFYCSNSSLARGIEYHNDTINPDPALPPDASTSNPRLYIANVRLEMLTDFPPPINPYPADASEAVELLPQFSWSGDADTYDILLGLQPVQLTVQATSLPNESWSPSSLLQTNTTYYWQVKAHYGQQITDSPVWHFTTGSTNGNSLPFEECFDLNIFPPNLWMRMEGLYQPNTILIPTTHGWQWDYFGNEADSLDGSANLNIYGRDCYHWLISPPLSGVAGTQAVIRFRTMLTNWNTTTQGQLGDDDKIRLVLFTGANPSLSNATILHEWTASDIITFTNDVPLTMPEGIYRIGFYGGSTVSNNDCDLFIDNFTILSANSISIESPANLTSQVEGNTIHLQWEAPNSYIPNGYKVYRNNHLIATSNQSEYTDLAVTQGQCYSYFITTLNESNEESMPSQSSSLICIFVAEPLLFDSFETYQPFSQLSASWIDLDADHNETFGLSPTDFPNEGNPSAFVVFDPSMCNPSYNAIQASDGEQFLAVFADSPPPNNDWLITPHLRLGTGSMLSFYARSLVTDYGEERFRVGISTSSAAPDSFHMITDEPYAQAPGQWAEFNYELSQYDGQDVYIAIQCVSYDCSMFAFDEFKVISEGGIVGNEDNHMPLAHLALSAYPNPFQEQCRITFNNQNKEPHRLEIFNIRGQRVYQLPVSKSDIDVAWNGKDMNNKHVASGVYIIRVKGEHSIVCRKIVRL